MRCPNLYLWPPNVPLTVGQCILDAGHEEKEDCVCEGTVNSLFSSLSITYRMTNLQTPCDGTPCVIEVVR